MLYYVIIIYNKINLFHFYPSRSTNRCMVWLQESPMCAGDALADLGPAFSWCTANASTVKAASHGMLNTLLHS